MKEEEKTINEIKSLFYEVKDLFPESNHLKNTEYSYSEDNKRFGPSGFRIGMWCVVISEKYANRVDIGTWNNIYRDINVDKKDITLEEAKYWILDISKHAQEQAAKQKIQDKKDRITIIFIIISILISVYLYFF